MRTKPASSYHHGDLRSALIEGALRALRDAPPDALSLRAVARAAGVTANAPYRHFPDKESLLAAAAEEGFRRLAEACRRPKGSPRKRLEGMSAAYLAFAAENPQLYALMFGPVIRDWERHEALVAAGNESFGVLVEAVAQAKGVDAETAVTDAVVLWSTVHGYATLAADGALECCPAKLLPKPAQLVRLAR